MRIVMILKKLLKMAASVGLAFLVCGSLFDTIAASQGYMADLKPHFIVVFALAFYAACTLSAFLFQKGFAVFSIVSFPFTYAIVGALGLTSLSVFVVPLTQFYEYVVVALAAVALFWAPVFDIIRVIRGDD